MRNFSVGGFFSSIANAIRGFVSDVGQALGIGRREPPAPPPPVEPPPEPPPPEAPPTTWKENADGPVSPGEPGYGEAARFVKPGELWSPGRPQIDYRGKSMTKEEAIWYVTKIDKAQHVLVIVEYEDEDGKPFYEVWLDYAE